ncbi:MAG: hypothetical protein ACOYOF_05630, partial [Verrucomicrobiaceae bacterium]
MSSRRGGRTGLAPGALNKMLGEAAMQSTTAVEVQALGKFRAFLRSVRAWLRGVLGTVAGIEKARREGKLKEGDNFGALVDTMLGLEGSKFSKAVESEAGAMLGEGGVSHSLTVGRTLNSQKKDIPKTSEKMPKLEGGGSFDSAIADVVAWIKANPIATDPDGKVILIANPENGSLEKRAEHWVAGHAKHDTWKIGGRQFDKSKFESVAAILGTIQGAQALAKANSGKLVYLRRYAQGELHAVFVNEVGQVTDYGRVDREAVTQYTLDPKKGIEGAEIVRDWTTDAPASSVTQGSEADRDANPGPSPADQRGVTSPQQEQGQLTADGDIVKQGNASHSLSPVRRMELVENRLAVVLNQDSEQARKFAE